MGYWRTVPTRSLAGALAFMLAGCAYSYVDSGHTRHVIGVVDIATPAPDSPVSSITLTTVGLALYRQADSHSFSFGYNQQTLVSLPANACLDLNRASVCDASNARGTTP